MVTVIQEGKAKVKTKVIYTLGCPNCGCKFCCEKEDFREIERTPNGRHFIYCPWCEKEIIARVSEMELTYIQENVPVKE